MLLFLPKSFNSSPEFFNCFSIDPKVSSMKFIVFSANLFLLSNCLLINTSTVILRKSTILFLFVPCAPIFRMEPAFSSITTFIPIQDETELSNELNLTNISSLKLLSSKFDNSNFQ